MRAVQLAVRGKSFAKMRKEEGREAYTTAVILRAEAIRKVWAIIHNLPSPSGVNQRKRRGMERERRGLTPLKHRLYPFHPPKQSLQCTHLLPSHSRGKLPYNHPERVSFVRADESGGVFEERTNDNSPDGRVTIEEEPN